MVDDEAAKHQVDGDIENETPLFVRILQSGPYSIGIALIGGAFLYASIRFGLQWLVYVAICFLIPFGLFLSCFTVQIVACIVWLATRSRYRSAPRQRGGKCGKS